MSGSLNPLLKQIARSGRFALRGLTVLALVGLATFGVACDGPCENLAQKICACQPNEALEQSCLVNVEFATQDPVDGENSFCEELLETCTCASIERGDYEACGLVQPRDRT